VIDSNADGLVNMLHYEDAAAATLAVALSTGFSKQVFVACDNEVTTREEICESAVASGLFPNSPVPTFAAESGAPGKICDCSVTRSLLDWQPKYTSFRVFMRRLGGEDVPDAENNDGKEPAEEKSLLWIPDDDDDLIGF
jgi:nucleoside-diphosphate-sugar epimerase